MENTGNKHLYIVTFGDSRQYRLFFDKKEDTPLIRMENELNSYLKERFPDDTFAYYTTPKIVEISPEHASQFEQYPMLDAAAIDDIKKVLVEEIEDMRSEKVLNSNAPYADAPL